MKIVSHFHNSVNLALYWRMTLTLFLPLMVLLLHDLNKKSVFCFKLRFKASEVVSENMYNVFFNSLACYSFGKGLS